MLNHATLPIYQLLQKVCCVHSSILNLNQFGTWDTSTLNWLFIKHLKCLFGLDQQKRYMRHRTITYIGTILCFILKIIVTSVWLTRTTFLSLLAILSKLQFVWNFSTIFVFLIMFLVCYLKSGKRVLYHQLINIMKSSNSHIHPQMLSTYHTIATWVHFLHYLCKTSYYMITVMIHSWNYCCSSPHATKEEKKNISKK